MADPMAYDARGGLPEPVVSELRQAVRLDVMPKGGTFALGYWTEQVGTAAPELKVALVEADAVDAALAGQTLSVTGPLAVRRWREFARGLCVGDVVRVSWVPALVAFSVQRRGDVIAEFRQNPALLGA